MMKNVMIYYLISLKILLVFAIMMISSDIVFSQKIDYVKVIAQEKSPQSLLELLDYYKNRTDTTAIVSYVINKQGLVDSAKVVKVNCISCNKKTIRIIDSLTIQSLSEFKSQKFDITDLQYFIYIKFKD